MEIPNCKNFSGYKPCFPGHNCLEEGCLEENPIGYRILIINLDAMGDVLMTTAQLEGLKNKYPVSTIHWITLKNAAPLLQNNHYIDKVFVYDFESLSILEQLKYDLVLNVDKSLRSGALAMKIRAKKRLGFGINENGKIIPLNKGAEYNYQLGMDDYLKFKVNRRTGEDYLAETFELNYSGADYVFNLSDEEIKFTREYMKEAGLNKSDYIIGFNTGCSNLFPNKKMTIEQHRLLIQEFENLGGYKIILLGGPEDTERNALIAEGFPDVINTPTNLGVRRGACFESIPQVVITGDSFGMHLAIALKKYVIAWFGLSCHTEIELFGRGVKLYPENLECSPCWKKSCPYNLECISGIDLNRIIRETVSFFNNL